MTTQKMTTQASTPPTKPIDKLKIALNAQSVREQFQNALRDHADAFIASIIDLVGTDSNLAQCDANRVILECLKAATLKLPINRALGFAWIVPYKHRDVLVPQFQIGYKGYIQLAIRSAQYRHINTGVVYEGETVRHDRISGEMAIEGHATGPRAIGYFGYLELKNGFSKSLYMTLDEVTTHAKHYSRAYAKAGSPWQTEFDAMAMKTTLRLLLSKFGLLSTEMEYAMTVEAEDFDPSIDTEIKQEANKVELAELRQIAPVQQPPEDAVRPPWE